MHPDWWWLAPGDDDADARETGFDDDDEYGEYDEEDADERD